MSNTEVIAMQSLKGRETPVEGVRKEKKKKNPIQTPALPFVTESYNIKKPSTKRPMTSYSTSFQSSNVRQKEGSYAIRFTDGTWGHTDPTSKDHYASREEILDVSKKYDKQIRTITASNDVERALALQSATDLLLDEISTQLRAECREQCDLLEKARSMYASIFIILQQDGEKCRDDIADLEKQKLNLEENLTKVIDNATERVKETQIECQRRIEENRLEIEQKKEEYDSSMKRFLEQKMKLEEHVRALHRVFLDFQNDSVYITLEDLKSKLNKTEKKVSDKEAEIQTLKTEISKIKRENSEKISTLTKANEELRGQLNKVIVEQRRRKLEFHLNHLEEEEGNEDKSKKKREHSDATPYLRASQKMNRVHDKIIDFLERTKNTHGEMKDNNSEEIDKLLLSGDPTLMIRAVDLKANECAAIADCLDNVIIDNDNKKANHVLNIPRFLQYIAPHNINPAITREKPNFCVEALIRQIFQAKWLSEKSAKRKGIEQSKLRFPEFVISYFSQEGQTLFLALNAAARLWRAVAASKVPELRLFRRALKEKITQDEMSFVLDVRYALLGLPNIQTEEPQIIYVSKEKCQEIVSLIFGQYSPSLPQINTALDKGYSGDKIDYALFITVLLDFYQSERRKRRNAVRLMFQSKRFVVDDQIDFENFVAMLQSLGFNDNISVIFELYREAWLLGSGTITIDSFLKAMDTSAFHFYTIEIPSSIGRKEMITQIPRPDLLKHWIRFSVWFEGFKKPVSNLDTWLKSTIVHLVKTVEKDFKLPTPASQLFVDYTDLLLQFQYMLIGESRGQNEPLSTEKSERLLLLLENSCDLILSYILRNSPMESGYEMTTLE